jgi:hypothetical protein
MDANISVIQRQRGSVLIVGLLILVVLTVLGIAAMGNMTMEERMAAAYQKMDLAFQGGQTAINSVANRANQSSVNVAFAAYGARPCQQMFAHDTIDVDPNHKVGGTEANSKWEAVYKGSTGKAKMIRGYELGQYEALVVEVKADTEVTVAGTVAAKSVQTQTIVVPSNSSYDCVYKTMEEELAGG